MGRHNVADKDERLLTNYYQGSLSSIPELADDDMRGSLTWGVRRAALGGTLWAAAMSPTRVSACLRTAGWREARTALRCGMHLGVLVSSETAPVRAGGDTRAVAACAGEV
eukprot:2789082-Rhodomonas_salina.4